MKKLILAIVLAGTFAAPTAMFAQDEPGEPGAEKPKSQQEMLAELHKLMKKASDEMGELEKELAKASLDSPKADVIAARIQELEKQMEEGKLDDMPEGLQKWVAEHPEEVAKATGKSNEEVKKIAENSEDLAELLKKNPELLKKLAENKQTIEGILEKQRTAEQKIEETLKKQDEAAEQARQKVDESLEMAHDIKAKGQGQGQGQPKNDKSQQTKDPRDGKEQGQNQSKQPSKGAEKQYDPGEGQMDPDNKVEEHATGEGAGFQADKQHKDMGNGAGSDEHNAPEKYKGFLKKFNEETTKKVAERKKEDK